MRRFFLFLLLTTLLLPSVSAEEREAYAFVIYAEGYDMTVFRNEELLTYDVLRDNVIGMPLLPGDLIQTDPETFVELQVMPSRTVIKVAENTTFRIEEIGGTGGGSFDLAYGRLRAKVDRISGKEEFQIRGRSAVAGVRGTDFGYDFVALPEGSVDAETQVYVFEGMVEVTEAGDEGPGGTEVDRESPTDASQAPSPETPETPEAPEAPETPSTGTQRATIPSGGSGGPRTIILTANQMVNVIRRTVAETLEQREEAPVASELLRFESSAIDEEIERFWQEKDFREEPVNPDEVEERFPEINKRVSQLATERRAFLLAQKRATLGRMPPEPTREPELRRLAVPDPEDRLRRSLLPEGRTEWSLSAVRGGAFLTATGTVVGVAALGLAFAGDQVFSGYDTGFDNPATNAALLSGGVFFSSGLISLIAGLFQT
ncbi:MAG: FecR domain-containing protein, partial [Spirochaetaceae bacterium]